MTKKIFIKSVILNKIAEVCFINAKVEHCGMLIGTNRNNEECYILKYAMLTNITQYFGRFEIPTYEVNRICNYSYNNGYDTVIFYHTHPTENVTASKLDIECMTSMNLPWIIFALDKKQNLKYALYLNGEEIPMEMVIEET